MPGSAKIAAKSNPCRRAVFLMCAGAGSRNVDTGFRKKKVVTLYRNPATAKRGTTEAAVMISTLKPPQNCRSGDCASERFSA
jgi:hypothetical protein